MDTEPINEEMLDLDLELKSKEKPREREIHTKTRTVNFDETKNEYYDSPDPGCDFYDFPEAVDEEHDIPKYVGGVANQINKMVNNSVFKQDDTNGLGWDSYSGGSSEYAPF